MIRDTQSFRERFNRWKNGESYWDIVGKPLNVQSQPRQEDTQNYPIDDFDQYIYSTSNPIGYNDGKDNALAYTNDYDDVLGLDSQKDQKVINMYDSVIVNGQRQTPTPNNPIVGYDGGKDIPEYGHGKSKSRVYSEEQLRKSLMNYGVTDPYMVAGIMGNAKIESGYNPDSVSKSGTYKGLWQLQPGYVQYVTDNYGNYDPESQIRFIADIVKGTLPETKSTTGKWLSIGVSKKLRQIKNTRPEQAAYNFQKYFEGAMGQNNSGRMNAARDVYDSYLFDKNKLTVDKIISQSQAVPVDVTRVQKPLVTYNPNTPTTYSNPAYAQKPVENIPTDIQRPKSILPNIIDTYNNLQNDQQPLIIQPKRSFIQPQWQNGKDLPEIIVNGKLPIWARDAIEKIKNSNTEFAQRLKSGEAANNTIPNWENNKEVSSLKMSWGNDDNNTFIFPVIQKKNNKLIDYSNPKYKTNAMKEAINNNDYIEDFTPRQAEWVTNNNYKYYFPGFKKYGY